ncbi:MFS transporter [Clavibacter tessellarius]
MLTAVFAVYVAGLLATLLTAGRLSDHIGRRPVILGALAVSTVAMLVFAFAHDGLALVVARILQGLAIGLATGALGAGMIDHQPRRRSGLAAFLNGVVLPAALTVGALGSGFLVAYGPAPEETVFVVLAALMVAAGIAVAFVPERQPRRAGALRSLIPSVAVPRDARAVFTAVVGGMIASWALGGMFLAFIGSVLGETFGLHSAALTGAAIALFTGTGAITGVVIRTRDARRSLVVGVVALVLGPVGLVAAIWTASLPSSRSPRWSAASASAPASRRASGSCSRRRPSTSARACSPPSTSRATSRSASRAWSPGCSCRRTDCRSSSASTARSSRRAPWWRSSCSSPAAARAGPSGSPTRWTPPPSPDHAASGGRGRHAPPRAGAASGTLRGTIGAPRGPLHLLRRPSPGRHPVRPRPNRRKTPVAFIVVLLVLWLILTVVGFAIKGLVWLGIIGIILVIGTIVLGALRRRYNAAKTPKA